MEKIKYWFVKFTATCSRRTKRECRWCKETSDFKLKHIWTEANPIGHAKAVCDECVQFCAKG